MQLITCGEFNWVSLKRQNLNGFSLAKKNDNIKRVALGFLVQLLISKSEMALAYASMKIVFVAALSLLPKIHAQNKNFAATMDTISKSEREYCFRQCSRQSSCRFFGVNMNGRCHLFAEAPLTLPMYMRRYQQPGNFNLVLTIKTNFNIFYNN